MLSAIERLVLRIAIVDGFVSENELTRSQVTSARHLAGRRFIKAAGREPDGTAVYNATDVGRKAFEEWG